MKQTMVQGYLPSGPQTTDVTVEGSEALTTVPSVETPVELPPAEEAAMKFTKLLPFVGKLADAMPSQGGLVRVIVALAEFPIGGREPRLLNASERQLFSVLQELNGYKSTVLSAFIENQAKLKQAGELPSAESETNV